MKNILCFGDSLTWGFNPKEFTRYPFEQRWTGFLQQQLGNDYRIIEEGLNGRTTVIDDPFFPYRNGNQALPMLLETHSPLDLVIILLGTNDIKPSNKFSAKEAACGCATLLSTILKSAAGPDGKAPQTLLLAPPPLGQTTNIMATVFEGAEEESRQFALHYKRVADFFNAHFLDTASFITVSKYDGLHLDMPENKKLAEKVAEKVFHIFS